MTLSACRAQCYSRFKNEDHFVITTKRKCFCEQRAPAASPLFLPFFGTVTNFCTDLAQICGTEDGAVVYSNDIFPRPIYNNCDAVTMNLIDAPGLYTNEELISERCFVDPNSVPECPSLLSDGSKYCLISLEASVSETEMSKMCYLAECSPPSINSPDEMEMLKNQLGQSELPSQSFINIGLVAYSPGIVGWKSGAPKRSYYPCMPVSRRVDSTVQMGLSGSDEYGCQVYQEEFTHVLCEARKSFLGLVSEHKLERTFGDELIEHPLMNWNSCAHICHMKYFTAAWLYSTKCGCTLLNETVFSSVEMESADFISNSFINGQPKSAEIHDFGESMRYGVIFFVDERHFVDLEEDQFTCEGLFFSGVQVPVDVFDGERCGFDNENWMHFTRENGQEVIPLAQYSSRTRLLKLCTEKYLGLPSTANEFNCIEDEKWTAAVDKNPNPKWYYAKIIYDSSSGRNFWENGEPLALQSPQQCSKDDDQHARINQEVILKGMVCERKIALMCSKISLINDENFAVIKSSPLLTPIACIEYCRGTDENYATYSCTSERKCSCGLPPTGTDGTQINGPRCLQMCVGNREHVQKTTAIYNIESYEITAASCDHLYQTSGYVIPGKYFIGSGEGIQEVTCDVYDSRLCDGPILSQVTWTLGPPKPHQRQHTFYLAITKKRLVVEFLEHVVVRGVLLRIFHNMTSPSIYVTEEVYKENRRNLLKLEYLQRFDENSKIKRMFTFPVVTNSLTIVSEEIDYVLEFIGCLKWDTFNGENGEEYVDPDGETVSSEGVKAILDELLIIQCVKFENAKPPTVLKIDDGDELFDVYEKCQAKCTSHSFGVIAKRNKATGNFQRNAGNLQFPRATAFDWVCSCIEDSDSMPTIYDSEECEEALIPDCPSCFGAFAVKFWDTLCNLSQIDPIAEIPSSSLKLFYSFGEEVDYFCPGHLHAKVTQCGSFLEFEPPPICRK